MESFPGKPQCCFGNSYGKVKHCSYILGLNIIKAVQWEMNSVWMKLGKPDVSTQTPDILALLWCFPKFHSKAALRNVKEKLVEIRGKKLHDNAVEKQKGGKACFDQVICFLVQSPKY